MVALEAHKSDSLCPEVKKATLNDTGWQSIEDHCRSTDSYAIASLVLEATICLEAQPSKAKQSQSDRISKIMGTLSPSANDFLLKALFHDPAWRLVGNEALAHPWLVARRC